VKSIKYLIAGILFGIILVKSEAMSWYRIQEMFRFQSFHMYGIIGTACAIGVLSVWLIKKFELKDVTSQPILFVPKNKSFWRYILGGSIFGLGWALSGACPGPLFVILGYGYFSVIIIILSAIAGTFLYGILKEKLPH
jgi:uncharacterized membrane protein YedE/YeeE